ncbi:MAG: sulfotransferase [Roseobacter sp.]|nr:sulfotransferase [Roseobacter sp.]
MTEITKLLAIIGCAKAGTTALAHHMDAHPEVRLGHRKETMYFSTMGQETWSGPRGDNFSQTITTDYDVFANNFGDHAASDWLVDASTDYVWRAETPALLAEYGAQRDVRVVCVVRDPVDRAISEYNHTLRQKLETLSFTESLKAEEDRHAKRWHPLFYHRRRSTISEDIDRYADRFGDRLMIIDYADLTDAGAVTERLCAFLGIPAMSVSEMERRNETLIPRNALVQSALKNQTLRGLSRSILPKRFRTKLRTKLIVNARDMKTVQPEERALFQDMIADEIEACVRNPLIPTDNWTCV